MLIFYVGCDVVWMAHRCASFCIDVPYKIAISFSSYVKKNIDAIWRIDVFFSTSMRHITSMFEIRRTGLITTTIVRRKTTCRPRPHINLK